MSLIVTVHVNEGIVMASDSRTTHNRIEKIPSEQEGFVETTVEQYGVYFTDTAYKTFLFDNGIGLSTCGNAIIKNAPITGYIEEFIRKNPYMDIDELPQKLQQHFQNLEPAKDTTFFVAGYKKDANSCIAKIYRINTLQKKIEPIDTSAQGALWDGERDILSRMTTELYMREEDVRGQYVYKKHTEHPIPWQYFTLQDAIDFAQYAIKSTMDAMRFQRRLKTVGGDVDILVIKPDGATWIARKGLHV